ISCSVVTPNWSDGEGGGVIHQALAQILGSANQPGAMLCFASAGNTIDRHWSGPFHDAGDGFHEWKTRQRDNRLTPWGSDQVSVELYSKPGADYDLYVYDGDTGKEAGHTHTSSHEGDRSSAVVRFLPQGGHSYQVRVRGGHGSVETFHLTSMNSSIDCTTP